MEKRRRIKTNERFLTIVFFKIRASEFGPPIMGLGVLASESSHASETYKFSKNKTVLDQFQDCWKDCS